MEEEGGWTSKRQWLEELSTGKRGDLGSDKAGARSCKRAKEVWLGGLCAAKERGLRMMQGYGEVGKVRGKMDIFWTSLTRPWWKSSKPKISGG